MCIMMGHICMGDRLSLSGFSGRRLIRRRLSGPMVAAVRLNKDKVGAGMGMARGGLGPPTDERQHKRVKPCVEEVQGFGPSAGLVVTSKVRHVHRARIYHFSWGWQTAGKGVNHDPRRAKAGGTSVINFPQAAVCCYDEDLCRRGDPIPYIEIIGKEHAQRFRDDQCKDDWPQPIER